MVDQAVVRPVQKPHTGTAAGAALHHPVHIDRDIVGAAQPDALREYTVGIFAIRP
jgi:hypothetical protein